MDPADIQRLKDIGHVLPHVVVAGKFPTRHITEEIQQLLHSRFAIVVVDGKPKFHCYNCKWSSLQKGHTRPLEHVCLEVPVKEPTWPVIFFLFCCQIRCCLFHLTVSRNESYFTSVSLNDFFFLIKMHPRQSGVSVQTEAWH